jgi:hypothetical protein
MRALRPAMPLLIVALAACTAVPPASVDPAAIPSGSLPAPEGATGAVTELGTGVAQGIGWRYSVYPAGDSWCTQLETGSLLSAGCGDLLPQGDAAFGSVGKGELDPGGLTMVEGITSERVTTVWLIHEDGVTRFPATMMPLDDAGLDGNAFVGIPPAEMVVTHVMAVAGNGEVLDTYELP